MATESENQPELASRATQDAAPQTQLKEPEWDVHVQLADLQEDPNSTLYSVKEFKDLGLSQQILDGLKIMNFRQPSKIQERALPLLMKNPPTNLIGQSQSGTGKTAAFVLNLLARTDFDDLHPQGLILAPSRELARQILDVVRKMASEIPKLQTVLAVPDPAQRGRKLEGQIVVGTPGTVMDLLRRKHLDVSRLKTLVLDEADNMLDQQGLGDQCHRVKRYVDDSHRLSLTSAGR